MRLEEHDLLGVDRLTLWSDRKWFLSPAWWRKDSSGEWGFKPYMSALENGGVMEPAPAAMKKLIGYAVAMALTGIPGLLALGYPAHQEYGRCRAFYAHHPNAKGHWLFPHGYLVVIGAAMLSTLVLFAFLMVF